MWHVGIFTNVLLIIGEIYTLAKKVNRKKFLFIVNFDKAWDFLNSVILQMGFSSIWISWIRGWLALALASFLVNNPPLRSSPSKKEFDKVTIYRLSFSLYMERLNVAMRSTCNKMIFERVKFFRCESVVPYLFTLTTQSLLVNNL